MTIKEQRNELAHLRVSAQELAYHEPFNDGDVHAYLKDLQTFQRTITGTKAVEIIDMADNLLMIKQMIDRSMDSLTTFNSICALLADKED